SEGVLSGAARIETLSVAGSEAHRAERTHSVNATPCQNSGSPAGIRRTDRVRARSRSGRDSGAEAGATVGGGPLGGRIGNLRPPGAGGGAQAPAAFFRASMAGP